MHILFRFGKVKYIYKLPNFLLNMIYALYYIDSEPLLFIEADNIDNAWTQVHNAGIKNGNNYFTLDNIFPLHIPTA